VLAYPRWDSNPQLSDFKSRASTDWATGAGRNSLPMHEGGHPARGDRLRDERCYLASAGAVTGSGALETSFAGSP
jgi:hypothetical protein